MLEFRSHSWFMVMQLNGRQNWYRFAPNSRRVSDAVQHRSGDLPAVVSGNGKFMLYYLDGMRYTK